MSGSGGGSGGGTGGGKFNPKSLHYDRSATLPPFLARLHAQHAPGNFDGPDPILAARRRPTKKPRSGSEEAEDAPLVLDEEGNVVDTVSVGRDGSVSERMSTTIIKERAGGEENTGEGEGEGEGDNNKDGKDGKEAKEAKEDKSVGIGASKKKRKVGKVIGGDDGSEQEQEKEQDGDDGKSKGKIQDKDSGNPEKAGEKPKPNKTTKKKTAAKKIKLSFGDGDEEG